MVTISRIKPWGESFRRDASRLRDYANNLWVEIALNAFGFLSGMMLARWLGPTVRGQLAAAMLWPGIISILVTLGLQHAFAYSVGVGWGNPKQLHRLAWQFSVAVGIPTMIAYWVLCPWILGHQFPENILVPRVFSLYIPTAIYAGFLLPIYQGVGDFQRWNIARVFRSGAWTFSVALLAMFSVLSVLNLLFVQIAILCIISIYLFSRLGVVNSEASNKSALAVRPLFRYAFAIYASGLAYTINQQLDQLLLSLWVTPSDLGQYAAAVTLSSMVLIIPAAVGAIGFSKISRAVANPGEQQMHIKVTLAWGAMLLIPVGLAITVLAPWLTSFLFGSSYAHAGELLRVLAPAATVLGLGMLLADVLRGTGKPIYATWGAVLGAVITVCGLALTLRRYGTWAAAWVSFVAYASMTSLQLVFLWWSLSKKSLVSSELSISPKLN